MPKLQEKSRKEWAKIWKARISAADRKHKRMVMDEAEKFIKEYTGDFTSDQDTGEKYKQVAQVINAVEEIIQPHLFFENPRMVAKSNLKKNEWVKRESLVEEMVNHEYKDLKDTGYGIELENERVVLDARIFGYGATQTVYDVDGDFIEESRDESMGDKLKNLVTGEQNKPKLTPVITEEKGHVTEYVSALDLLLDPTASHITRQAYTIKRMDLSLDKLRRTRYEQESVDLLKPSILRAPDMGAMSDEERKKFAENNPDFNGFRVFEIHDNENRVLHTMVDGFDDFIEFATPYGVKEGSALTFLWFMDNINDVYPVAPFRMYRKKALEFSYVYSTVAEQIDKLMPKLGVDLTKLDRPDQEKVKRGGLGAVFGTKGPPAGAAQWFTSSGSVPELIKYLAMVKELLNLESGVNEYELASPEKRKATEALQIQQGTTSRRFKPRKRVAGFLKNQGFIIWQTVRDNAPFRHFAGVLGEEEAREWWDDPVTGKQAWSSPEIKKDYGFDFDMDSVAPVDTKERERLNNERLQMVLNPDLRAALKEDGLKLRVSAVFERWVEENLKVRDKASILEPLNVLEPGDEHLAWMNGKFPPITPDEASDPERLADHFKQHNIFIESPGFQTLAPEIQAGAVAHRDSYLPILARLQASGGSPSRTPPKEPSAPTNREQVESLVGESE